MVRKLGGDAETGGQYLDPPQPLQLFGNKLRNIRLPKGSKAADMMPEEFCAEIERMYQDAVARGNTPAVANAALESLRSALRPRDADEAPVPSPAYARGVSNEQIGTAAPTPPQTQSLPGPSGSDSLSAARQPDQQNARGSGLSSAAVDAGDESAGHAAVHCVQCWRMLQIDPWLTSPYRLAWGEPRSPHRNPWRQAPVGRPWSPARERPLAVRRRGPVWP